MKKAFFSLFLLILAIDLDAAQSPLASSINDTSLDMQRQLTKDRGEINTFFSPLSISAALAMTSAGAKGNTLKEMQKTLHLPKDAHQNFMNLIKILDQTKESSLNIANKLWGQVGLDIAPDFSSTLKTSYRSGYEAIDFVTAPESARKKINAWVEDKTKNKIKDLIAPGNIDSSTRFVIANAIYFKGQWKESFDPNSNIKADFYSTPKDKKITTFMKASRKFNYFENADYQLVEIPYKNDELNLVVILPREGKSLSQIESNLKAKDLASLPHTSGKKVEILFPKFTSEIAYELNNLLINMGMKDAFNANRADFSAIASKNSKKRFHISKVIHKAFVEMSEQGTEAAAATAIVMVKSLAVMSPPILFNANRPFLYFIRHEASGVVLFAGKLVSP